MLILWCFNVVTHVLGQIANMCVTKMANLYLVNNVQNADGEEQRGGVANAILSFTMQSPVKTSNLAHQ